MISIEKHECNGWVHSSACLTETCFALSEWWFVGLHSVQQQILPNTDLSPLESELDHIYQSKFALLFDWQNTDEGLIKHTSFRQLVYDLRGLRAAWRWNVDLLGEFDMTILKGIEGIVGPHSDLQELMHDENNDSITPINVRLSQCDLHVLLGGISAAFVSQGCCQHGQSYLFSKWKERLGSYHEFRKDAT